MKSGGGVLLVGLLQLCIGLVLLGTYEGFKVCGCDVSGTCIDHPPRTIVLVLTTVVLSVVQVAEAKRTKIVAPSAGKLTEIHLICCTSMHSLHLGGRCHLGSALQAAGWPSTL